MVETRLSYLEKNQSKSLLKTKLSYLGIRFKKICKTRYIFVTSLILLISMICFGLIFTIGINTIVSKYNITYIYFLEVVVYSVVNITLVIYLIWKLFYDDNNDGVNKLELRIGLTKQFMYFYRLLLILLLTMLFLLTEYFLNAIFYWASFDKNQLFSFRLFISPFTWLAFISFFTIFISLLITIIFKSRFIIIFSVILSMFILILSPLSGNFISNKAVANNNPIALQKDQPLSWWEEYSLTDGDYLSLGLKFTNLYELYKILEIDNNYNFLEFIKNNYDENLSNEENLINITNESDKFYYDFNEKLNKIYQAHPNDVWYEEISKELIKTNDNILIKFGEILSNFKLSTDNSKFLLFEENALKNLFYDYIFNSFLACEQGIELDFVSQYQIKLIDQFNQKMKKNAYLNPLYGLNLMFFGDNSDYVTDNLINRTKPLFKQALNITYNIDVEYKSNGEKFIVVINSSTAKKTISPSYYVLVNVLIFAGFSSLMYFGYQIKK